MTEETRSHPRPPRLTAAAADAATHALLAHAITGPWPALGALLGETIRLEALHLHGPAHPLPPGTPGAGDVVLVLTTPEQGRAQLVLSGGLVRGLLALATGTSPGPLVPASPAEAGLLAGLAAAALEDRSSLLQLQDVALPGAGAPDALPLGPAEATAAIHLAVGPHRGAIHALFDAPARRALWDAARRAPPPGVDPDRIPVIGHYVLATARLAWSEVATLEPGDAVLFPGHPAPTGEWPGWLRVGTLDYPATARATAHGRELEIRGAPMHTDDDPGPDLPASGDLLERLPVTLRVSLGTVELTAADVARLQPGVVITLDRPLGEPVTVHAGSRRIATGELVEVDGALGVRLRDVQL